MYWEQENSLLEWSDYIAALEIDKSWEPNQFKVIIGTARLKIRALESIFVNNGKAAIKNQFWLKGR